MTDRDSTNAFVSLGESKSSARVPRIGSTRLDYQRLADELDSILLLRRELSDRTPIDALQLDFSRSQFPIAALTPIEALSLASRVPLN